MSELQQKNGLHSIQNIAALGILVHGRMKLMFFNLISQNYVHKLERDQNDVENKECIALWEILPSSVGHVSNKGDVCQALQASPTGTAFHVINVKCSI